MRKEYSVTIFALIISIMLLALVMVSLDNSEHFIKDYDPSHYAESIPELPVLGISERFSDSNQHDVETSADSIPYNSLVDSTLEITTNDVGQGCDLIATAIISNLSCSTIMCDAEWYLDGEPLLQKSNLMLHNGSAIVADAEIKYSQDMILHHNVGLKLISIESNGEEGFTYQQAEFDIKNYSDAYYKRAAAADAIINATSAADVTSTYSGGGSSSYDVDYPKNVKTSFINEGGYSSKTNYLAWVNLATQKVNIFTGSQGSWKLSQTFRCATGSPSSPTPTGVTYVTQKQSAWVTDDYTVKYVTRFYPNSGYAFHSILYTPDGSKVQSGAMGYPTSHGCVRTEDAGVQWIYKNLPINSTVVIF